MKSIYKTNRFPLFIALLLMLNSYAFAQQKKAEKTNTGTQDRELWVKALYKISYPVIHNLANGTLKKNMPLEIGPGYYNKVQEVTYLEALGRTLAGVAPWLSLPMMIVSKEKCAKRSRRKF